MKKIFFLLIFVAASLGVVNAQDVITTVNGEDIKVKVLEITVYEVKYRLYNEPDGIIYTVDKSDILMIHYESGRTEVFTQKVMPSPYYPYREPVDGIVPGMKYRELKRLYNYKDYTPGLGDIHPGWTGVASFFIPGLGECIHGEWGRGLGKFFGNMALMSAATITFYAGCYADNYAGYYDEDVVWPFGVAAVFFAGAVGLNIWSIIDAVRIAKVKNMYEQDLRYHYSYSLNLYPSFQYVQLGNTMQPTVGFTLALQF